MRPRYVRSIDDWARVEKQISAWKELDREMRCGRSWLPITEGAIFAPYWKQGLLIQPREVVPDGGLVLVGIDHGLQERRQRAVLSIAYTHGGDHQEVWTLAEYAPEGATTPRQDGEGIVEMVLEAGLVRGRDALKALRAVDIWVGDRPIQKHRIDIRKSNRRIVGGIRAHLAQVYGKDVTQSQLPQQLRDISTPSKRRGSDWTAISYLQDLMIQERTRFHPRCKQLIRDIQTWEGNTRSAGKDGLDAWRYPVEEAMRQYGVWRWN